MYNTKEIFQLITDGDEHRNVLINVFHKYIYYFDTDRLLFSLIPFPYLKKQTTRYMSANSIDALLPLVGKPFNVISAPIVGRYSIAKKEDMGYVS